MRREDFSSALSDKPVYSQISHEILVEVEPSYLPDQSLPDENLYLWAYRVTIENRGQIPVRLMSRYWRITDNDGRTQEFRGEGVVGEQPVLEPGEVYRYTSGAPLATPGGMMMGQYFMKTRLGKMLAVDIPAFSLDSPYQRAVLN